MPDLTISDDRYFDGGRFVGGGAPRVGHTDPADSHAAHIAAVLDARAGDAEILRRAASDLKVLWEALDRVTVHDALWDQAQETDAIVRARLRDMADKIDPKGGDDE